MHVTAPHAPGTFCWGEIATTDPAAAKKFYGGLFGWTHTDVPMGPDAFYTKFQLDSEDIVGMYAQDAAQRTQGVPPNWASYIAVANVDQSAARAAELGATIVMPPFDVLDIGRMTLLQDPTGAFVALWEAKSHIGAGVLDEPGAMCWHELMTRGADRARAFYTGLLGWDATDVNYGIPYTLFRRGDQNAAGLMEMPPEMASVPPHWMPYISVTDCDATVAHARELGGRVLVPPTDVPTVGRFATLADPQGVAFSVIRLGT